MARSDYHTVAQGHGAVALLIDKPEQVKETLTQAKALAQAGKPVLINVLLDKTDFRKGSLSM
ncbi:MAG TPA: hypothetical protein ENJ56_07925 [Anaerolineae bacterium]|nr:hypothetical protein [Anaerolineae bacterium]